MSAVPPKSYSISDFKSRALNLAQTSLYQLTIVPPPRIFQQTENISLLCHEATLPGSSLATHQVTNDHHGVTEKMAYRRMYDESFNLTFYVDYQYNVVDFFERWIEFVVGQGYTQSRNAYRDETAFYRMTYPVDYKQTIYISKFEKDYFRPSKAPFDPRRRGGTNLEYELIGAFPYNIVSMPVSYNQSDILKCSVGFYFTRYVVEKKGTVTYRSPGFANSGNTDAQRTPPTTSQQPINAFDYSKMTGFKFDKYYNNFGVDAQDNTNFGNYFNGRRVDQGVFGAEAQA